MRRTKRPLTEAQILAWADAHHARTGQWPNTNSGLIQGAPGEDWLAVDLALHGGYRGLGGRSTLRHLLTMTGRNAERRLTVEQILAWADAQHAHTGQWPRYTSGAVFGEPGEVWSCINSALRQGLRGLPGRSTLAQLLEAKRGVARWSWTVGPTKPLTEEQILAWADAHYARTGRWPGNQSGRVVGSRGDAWSRINTALIKGWRGLPGGSSLAQLLEAKRGVCRWTHQGRPLSEQQILVWADAHYARTGCWPQAQSGCIPGTRGETWARINAALDRGKRELPGGSSLARLLKAKRGVSHTRGRKPKQSYPTTE